MLAAKVLATLLLASSPFSLTVAPAHIATALHPGSTARIEVFNTGKTDLQIHMVLSKITRIHGVCRQAPGGVSLWADVTPPTFALRSGQRRAVRIRISDAHGSAVPRGEQDLAIAAVAALGRSGAVRIDAAVVVQALTGSPARRQDGHA
jgi:hypothetical protein